MMLELARNLRLAPHRINTSWHASHQLCKNDLLIKGGCRGLKLLQCIVRQVLFQQEYGPYLIVLGDLSIYWANRTQWR